ncbi:MAG TPA: Gfo/Idh/MocA family oxidoreductase [Verrucomicrobiota bacterium]|nr:Gfo/Idh/MocA family oxidoreductase [Verrucomicrobiota bacterium]
MNTPRRQFLETAATLTTAATCLPFVQAGDPATTTRRYRAAIIGHTGHGDYGHGYDQIFNGLENVSVEAVADPHPAGLQKAAARSGAKRQYADYRTMLDEVRPDLVCIAPRHPGNHREMALAALEVCRGLFIEKPFTETLVDADAILAAAHARGVPIQIAHNRRYTREFVHARTLIRQGLIGEVRQIEIHGKQDARVGGEDLIVLGVHDFDLMRFYFGDPLWCQASVSQNGRPITRADIRQGREPLLVAGDTIHALFAFPDNTMLHWSSVKRGGDWNTPSAGREKWCLEILGTKGILAYQPNVGFVWLDSPFFAHHTAQPAWTPAPLPQNAEWPEHARHPIASLIRAIETGAPPVSSGDDGRWTIEMVSAVYESERTRTRIPLPLTDRNHPLTRF